ncbi:hypothetical protein ACFWDP_26560, partial [Streptomyces anthocyanicus]|uniref:hypothetical protein n=1 Tax=Streptomyces anthocyanicus TaxID=68174 RepID=UPI00369FEA4B
PSGEGDARRGTRRVRRWGAAGTAISGSLVPSGGTAREVAAEGRAGGRAPLQEVQHAGQRRGAGVRRPQGGVPAVGAGGARCQEGRRTDFVQAEKAVRDGVARTVVVAG